MYEQFRSEFIGELSNLECKDIPTSVKALDNVSSDWQFKPACTELAIRGRDEAFNLGKNFLACKKLGGCSDATLDNLTYILKNFFCALNKPLSEVTTNDVRIYLAYYQKEKKIKEDSLEWIRRMLHTFFQWLVEEEYIAKNPVSRVPKIKGEQHIRHALTIDQLNALRGACADDRERAILEFLYSTGARVSELCGVKLDDVDFNSKEVRLFGKGKKERISYLSNTAVKACNTWLAVRPHPSIYLFNNIRGGKPMNKENIEKIFRRLSKDAGLPPFLKATPHVIRHTTATQAIEHDMPVEEVQKLLGHANLGTTMIYVDLADKRVKERHASIFD